MKKVTIKESTENSSACWLVIDWVMNGTNKEINDRMFWNDMKLSRNNEPLSAGGVRNNHSTSRSCFRRLPHKAVHAAVRKSHETPSIIYHGSVWRKCQTSWRSISICSPYSPVCCMTCMHPSGLPVNPLRLHRCSTTFRTCKWTFSSWIRSKAKIDQERIWYV